MINKLSVSAAALATLGLAAPAMAQQNIYDDDVTVDINVAVEDIAVLEVESPSATMTIDDDSDTFMGNASSAGSDFGNLAVVKLSTNFDVDGIFVDYPRADGFRNPDSSTFFGVATGQNTDNTLGVFPAGGPIAAPNDPLGPGEDRTGHDGTDSGFGISGATLPVNTNIDTPFGNGVHYFGLGVSTNWDRTLPGEPVFAEPDTYTIELEATILPTT